MLFGTLYIMLIAFGLSLRADAQLPDQPIYTDSLQNGWQNYGWATLNYANTSPVHSGQYSISVAAGGYQALYVHHSGFDSTPYSAISFWINAGNGGQSLVLQGELSGSQKTPINLGTLPANTWKQITISLSSLGVADQSNLDGFWIENTSAGSIPTFYVDDITLISSGAAIPTSANISVNAQNIVRTVDPRIFGMNTAVWDGALSTPSTLTSLHGMNTQAMRFPGGSTSDAYDWSTDKVDGNTNRWPADVTAFNKLASAASTESYDIVNYGSGTPQMAAAWVAYDNGVISNDVLIGHDVNGRDWKSSAYWASIRSSAPLATDDGYNFLRVSHPLPFNSHYWEIGNECFGSWENDKHALTGTNLVGLPHDGYTYAKYASQFINLMKAVDPTIQIGTVAIEGEDAWGDGKNGVVNVNENNTVHSGWTPVVLSNLEANGTTPDFVIDHEYAQQPSYESDSGLLQVDRAWLPNSQNLRKMLTDYAGPAGAGIPLDITEANSVSSSPGKQTTSLVNGLFAADSIGAIVNTEYASCLWWDLHNGSQYQYNNSTSLYGWRQFGDYGVVATGDRSDTPLNTPYPTFYGLKLASAWASGGDQIVQTTSDYNMLACYGAQKQDGSLSLLLINKSATMSLTGHVGLVGFVPSSATATYQRYGIPEDGANGSPSTGTISTPSANFDVVVPPYSITVVGLPGQAPGVPVAPGGLTATAASQSSIVLHWLPAQFASKYTVSRSTVSGGPYAAIGSTTGTSFADSHLASSATYFYVVAASDAAGNGANSSEVRATTMAGPQIVTLNASDSAYVRDGSFANSSFASDTSLYVKNVNIAGYDRVAYLKFDLRNVASIPTSAVLNLVMNTSNTTGSSSAVLKAYAVTDTSWSSSSLTWNSAITSDNLLSNITSSGTLVGSAVVGLTPGIISWDLTSYLRTKIGSVVTIQIINDTSTGLNAVFNSTRAMSGDPALVLTFAPASTPTSVPSAPTGLTASAASATSIYLTWTPTTGAANYDVLRSSTMGGPYALVANVSTNSYGDSGLAAGTEYYYIVAANNAVGSSTNSSEAHATTASATVVTQPQTLNAVDSTYVRGGGYDTTNYSTDTVLVVKNNNNLSYDRVTYLKFDLTHVTTIPSSAKLNLTLSAAYTNGAQGCTINAYGIGNSAWTGATLNWNLALASEGLSSTDTSLGLVAASKFVGTTPGIYTWDVTSYLQNNIGKLVTIQLLDPVEDSVADVFNTSRSATGQPNLTLTF